jgi:hypothetical protein
MWVSRYLLTYRQPMKTPMNSICRTSLTTLVVLAALASPTVSAAGGFAKNLNTDTGITTYSYRPAPAAAQRPVRVAAPLATKPTVAAASAAAPHATLPAVAAAPAAAPRVTIPDMVAALAAATGVTIPDVVAALAAAPRAIIPPGAATPTSAPRNSVPAVVPAPAATPLATMPVVAAAPAAVPRVTIPDVVAALAAAPRATIPPVAATLASVPRASIPAVAAAPAAAPRVTMPVVAAASAKAPSYAAQARMSGPRPVSVDAQFPIITAAVQRERDNERLIIIEEELRAEESLLAEAVAKSASQEVVRRYEDNVAALKREIDRLNDDPTQRPKGKRKSAAI